MASANVNSGIKLHITSTELSNDTTSTFDETSGFNITLIYWSSGVAVVLFAVCVTVCCICRKKNQEIPITSDTKEKYWITEPHQDRTPFTHYNAFRFETEEKPYSNSERHVISNRLDRINSRPVSGPEIPWIERTSNCQPKRVTFYDDNDDYLSMKGERVYILDAHLRVSFVSDRLSSWASCGELRKSCMTNASGSYVDMHNIDVCGGLRESGMTRQHNRQHTS